MDVKAILDASDKDAIVLLIVNKEKKRIYYLPGCSPKFWQTGRALLQKALERKDGKDG